jgi:hypothetical protein
MSGRKDIHHRLPGDALANSKRTAKILSLKQEEAAEIALREWIKGNRHEAQKRLDMYAEKGVVINTSQSVSVNVAVFQKAALLVAKDKMQRLLDILPDIQDPASRRETQLELAKALKVIQPVFVKTRDPKLTELLAQAEAKLG